MKMTTLRQGLIAGTALVGAGLFSGAALADNHGGTYEFDRDGQHQFIQFRISHLGFQHPLWPFQRL